MSATINEPATGAAGTPSDLEKEWQERIADAEKYRKKFEPIWLSNLAFVAGQHWLVMDTQDPSRTLRHISEVDPRYEDVELYTADVVTEQRAVALGELQSNDDRPELLLPGNGEADEDEEEIQEQANRAVGHGWQFEWDGDEALLDMRRKVVDMGVAAIRCRFNPAAGEPKTDDHGQPIEAPVGPDGHAITDATQARAYVAQAQQAGQTVQFKPLHDGRICWEVGSAFNILVPPGIPHEKDFPWEIWVRPALLEDVKAEYGQAARDLVEDADITSVLGTGVKQALQADSSGTQGQQSKLKGHVWLYTGYQRPSAKYPQGMMVVLAGASKKLLKQTNTLEYKSPDGTWHSGVTYFHWWRLNDRFYSKSLIEGLKDPQRFINRRKTQGSEIIDRGMPFILVEEDSIPQKRQGSPLEFVELKKTTQVQPQVQGGVGPGEWMYRDVQEMREDLAHASTFSALKLGENPANVQTYSQLALLNEQENIKRQHVHQEHALGVATLVEDSVYDIVRYWPAEKQILVAGEDNRLQADLFQKNTIPTFYVVRPAKGSGKPRSQAAQLKMIEDIWNAALQAGAIVANPDRWVEWRKESMEAGQPRDLPEVPAEEQTQKAELENHAMMNGADPPVAYYDRPDLHIPVHRSAQDHALLAGDIQTWQSVENHVQQHLQVSAANAQRVAALAPPPLPVDPNAPHPAAQPSQPPPGQ